MNTKKAIICSKVENYQVNTDLVNTHKPNAGDVALFEVLTLGKHTRIQCAEKRNRHIYPGDTILAAFGTRYATNQLEGYVPETPLEEYHILGQGGVIGELKSMHQNFVRKGPTTLKMIGYATDDKNKVINTKYLKDDEVPFIGLKPNGVKVILSIGGSMDSGKTTTAAFLCKGLKNAGKRVVFTKLTGTVYSKDTDFVKDCGADFVTDFSQWGFPSTFMCSEQEILNLYQNMIYQLSDLKPDYIVMEIADGLLQRETNILLNNKEFIDTINHIVYSDGNSTGALGGIRFLNEMNLKPFAISGRFTMAPLLIEEVKAHTNIPVLTLEDLSNANVLGYFEEINTPISLSNINNEESSKSLNYAI